MPNNYRKIVLAMILLTGGTGFLGSYLLYALFRKGKKIIALRRKESSFKQLELIFNYLSKKEDAKAGYDNFMNSIQWVETDLLNLSEINGCFDDIDEIYHSAAYVSFNQADKKNIFDVNVNGTSNLINLALKMEISKFHYVSSTAALDRNDFNIIRESNNSSIKEFATNYAESKFLAELEVWRGYNEGLEGVIINPGVILGVADPLQNSNKVFKLIQKGFSFYPDGKTGYVDVKDVISIFLKLSENPDYYGKRYLLVSENIKYKDTFELMAKYFNVKAPSKKANKTICYALANVDKVRSVITGNKPIITRDLVKLTNSHYEFDNSKIRNTLDYEFIPIEKTIKEICEFLQSI